MIRLDYKHLQKRVFISLCQCSTNNGPTLFGILISHFIDNFFIISSIAKKFMHTYITIQHTSVFKREIGIVAVLTSSLVGMFFFNFGTNNIWVASNNHIQILHLKYIFPISL